MDISRKKTQGRLDGSRFVRPDLKSVSYSAVETPEALALELGLSVDAIEVNAILKVNANENAYGPHARLRAAVGAACLEHPLLLHVYPDPDSRALRQSIADTFGTSDDVGAAQVVVGAGSDDVMEVLLRVTGATRVIISTPTFGMYSFLACQYKASVVDVPRSPENNFAVDVDGIVRIFDDDSDDSGEVSVVFLTSPNNPTATLTPLSDVSTLCTRLAHKSVLIVVDEAYFEFVEHFLPSAAELLPLHSNLVILRTFSKWAGLAGLRAGYALCPTGLAKAMFACRQPYHLTTIAAAAAQEALSLRPEIMLSVRALYDTTQLLRSALSGPEFASLLRPIPGCANFVLVEVLDRPAETVFRQLRSVGVMVRYFGSQGGALEAHVRISAPTESAYPRLLRSLRAVRDGPVALAAERARVVIAAHRPKAILFDMDGVLADVSSSYRQAIVLTARRFGVDVSADDISQIKAAGNANNDWLVSQRLIVEKWASSVSQPPEFEEVKEVFEELYQGTGTTTGLWTTERLLVRKSLLTELAATAPLAIVTGRPRSPDCERFLEQHGIAHLFSVVVCADDTSKLKPSPEPVLLALSKLGEPSSSIFLGDTVDDVKAAIAAAANVLPIGVLLHSAGAPSCSCLGDLKTLEGAGAAGVVSPGCPELFEACTAEILGAAEVPSAPVATVAEQHSEPRRTASLTRKTLETEITVSVDLDGSGRSSVSTGVGFYDHMLCALAKHGRFNIDVQCVGDLHIDDHHTVEDVAITLGQCFKRAIGERRGIRRYGSAYAPLDDALVRAVVDVSSRPFARVQLCMTQERLGTMATEMLAHVIESFCVSAELTVHVEVLTPTANNHHKAEAAFKALALALRESLSYDASAGVPSTKGLL